MSQTSARVLELLTLLQSRRRWSGDELAHRLEVSPRTLRRDVTSLQDLGYPITTRRGAGGGYHLVPGASLPPLVLNEDEAAAVVIALKEAATGYLPTEATAAVTALAKITQVLPDKIRSRVDSLQRVATLPGPHGHPAVVDTSVLTTFALAARDHETLTFDYIDTHGNASSRLVQPHHVVSLDQRLYLIAHDLTRQDWRTFRIDRSNNPVRTGRTFMPRTLPVTDPAEYVRTQTRSVQKGHNVVATVELPADRVQEHLAEWGTATPLTPTTCTVQILVENLDWAAFALASLHAPFTVRGPDAAIKHFADWGQRLSSAVCGG